MQSENLKMYIIQPLVSVDKMHKTQKNWNINYYMECKFWIIFHAKMSKKNAYQLCHKTQNCITYLFSSLNYQV